MFFEYWMIAVMICAFAACAGVSYLKGTIRGIQIALIKLEKDNIISLKTGKITKAD